MLNPLVDTRDVKFVLFELFEIENLTKNELYADFDRDTFESVLDLAEQIAVEVIYPIADEGDKVGAKWDPATKLVTIPPCYKPALDKYYEAGFIGVADAVEHCGMGMPSVLGAGVGEFMTAAAYPMNMYPGLSHGAALLIWEHGTDEQKKVYAEKIMSGQWGGTMALTEPDAGSDVGNLKTKAVKQADGTYKITGQKIFISSGENDYFENMVHPTLARIEGDPKGTKGISIFIVPKYRPNAQGQKGEFNDVTCPGIEHKLGLHGQATSQLAFGDNGNCIGYLLGKERQGMKIMFQMMNEARQGVAIQGVGNASAAYMHAVTYTKNRLQGVDVTQMMNPEAPLVNISRHPDVKRMLLWMKSHLEGERILMYYLFMQMDLMKASKDEKVRKEAEALIEILTPIGKAGCTDKGVEITSMAMQCFGGYGYCTDYPIARYLADSKILAIYEGTNGIQSMDLMMRKIMMNKDQYNYSVLKTRMEETVSKAKGIVEDKYLALFAKGIKEMDEVIEMLKKQLVGGKFLNLFMHATPLQEAMFMICMAWCHVWSMTITIPKMKQLVGDAKGADREKLLNDNNEAAYYTGRTLSAQFYLGSEFPKVFGRFDAMKFDESATIKASDACFTGALAE